MKCVFCEMDKIKKRMICENDLALAFPTNIPITIGHTLVAPKRCVPRFGDLSWEEKRMIFELAGVVKKALIETFGAQGFNVAYNENEVAGQSLPHFHLHIVPRKKNDSGIYEYEPRKFVYRPGSREVTPDEELKAVASEIRRNI